MKQYKRIIQEDITLNRIQDSMEDFASSIVFPAITGINTLNNITINVTDTLVNHKLNKAYTGYLVINRNANSVVYTSSTTNNNKNLYIILQASATVTVDIMFF